MSLSDKFSIIIPPQDIACNPDCILRLANGDQQAFEWVYKNYSKKIYDYALILTGNEIMSEDIVQEVFLKLWRHRQKLKKVENFNSYLYILYRNYILDVMREHQKEISVSGEYCRDAIMPNMIADDIIDYKQAQQRIAKVVMQLPQQQQLVYRLSRDCGWKRHQIAKELKLSPFTVKAHIQLALRFLRKKLS